MKKLSIITLLLLFAINPSFAQTKSKVRKLPDDERMAWWRDAKFGMFIHWGAYSIIGGERGTKIAGGGAEWAMDKLDYTVEDYEKFPEMFNPELFDADAWVSMAKDAGMKYIVITSKHHEGFGLWDSKVSNYDIMDTAPFKRDIIKELSEACKKQGIKFCFYYSIVDWHHPQAQGNLYPNYNIAQHDDPSVVNPEFPEYFKNYMKPQVEELLTNYGDIGVVWFDGDWITDYTTEMGKELYSFIRDIQPNTIINNRVDKGRNGMEGMDKEGNFAGDFGTPEQEIPDTGIDSDWEACMTMNGSWGYKPADNKWKSSEDLIQKLVDIVSKGGNFLLNIGPDGYGRFPAESIRRLKAMGEWTKKNGEAIYGVSASPVEKPKWGRYTKKDDVVYVHVFDWPKNGILTLNKEFKVKKASLLSGSKSILKTTATSRGAIVALPMLPPDHPVTVIKVQLEPADWANLGKYEKANKKLMKSSKNVKAVFMGNSITEGWVRFNPDFFTQNNFIGRGISGQTTPQMVARFKQDVIDLNPEVVTILAGTNDIAGNSGFIAVPEIAKNIFTMAEMAKKHNIKVVLASVLPANSYSWSPSVAPIEKIIELNELIKNYAEANNLVYLDYYSEMVNDKQGLKKELGRDTVHPNAKGYEIMEPLVKKAIEKTLSK